MKKTIVLMFMGLLWLVAAFAIATLIGKGLGKSMEQNCIIGAMKGTGNPPKPEVVKWCQDNF